MLEVASVETADSGDYTCSATANDSSDSQYVLSSEPATATATVTDGKLHSMKLLLLLPTPLCSVCYIQS